MLPISTDMVTIHRVFRREFALLPELIRAVEPGDRERAAVLADHLDLVLGVLHHHHEGEDLLLWPRLEQRAPESRALFAEMDAQHGALGERLHAVTDLLARWRADPDSSTGRDLAAAVAALREPLVAHLDQEEREILPLVDALLTPDEWAELGQRAFSQLTPDHAMIVLAQMAEESPEQEWAWFLGHLPEPVQTAYAEVAAPAYPGYVARVRGAVG